MFILTVVVFDQKLYSLWGWRDIKANRVLALYVINLSLIHGIPYGSLIHSTVIIKC